MFRILAASTLVAVTVTAVPAAATTTVVNFSTASCTPACGNGSQIDQTTGDTVDVDLSYRAPNGQGNGATIVDHLRYWDTDYSGSNAAWSDTDVGEVRFDVLTPGTLTLDSVDLGGWVNRAADMNIRVYDLSYNLLSSATYTTLTSSLLTVTLGQSSTSGLIFQFGPEGFNAGIQNLTYSFTSVTAVPEPASWAMLIAGFGLIGATLRRRRAAIA